MKNHRRKLSQIHVDIRVVLNFPDDVNEDLYRDWRQVIPVREGGVTVAVAERLCYSGLCCQLSVRAAQSGYQEDW